MRSWWTLVALGALGAVAGYGLADSYISRLSDHRGYELVEVEDRVAVAPAVRPRRVLMVLVDGLRRDHAAGMPSLVALRQRGGCYATHTGVPSVSRPMYAVYSTGLEQDRTGSRNNDTRDPMRARSVWQTARAAGLTVEGRSEGGAWWQQLFPDGFDRYAVIPYQTNAFPASLTADVTLIHPIYVDETAHQLGVGRAYAAAVARVDGELAALLATVDLDHDAVMVTSDHGHRDRGGHGSDQPIIATVLTCMAGRGVAHVDTPARTLEATTIGPLLSVLLGIPFPPHMRAQDDDLDAIWAVLDERVLGAAYAVDRRTAVARFRLANQQHLATLGASTWREHTERRRGLRVGRFVALSFAGCLLALWLLRQRGRWILTAPLGLAIELTAYAAPTGGIDASTVSNRPFFINNALASAIIATATLMLLAAALTRGRLTTRLERVAGVVAAQTACLGAVSLAHVIAFGWPLGYPVPPPLLYFAPFWLSIYLMVSGCGTVLAGSALAVCRLRA